MKITSLAFEHNSKIPSIYTCDGKNVNPPLSITDVSGNAESLVLIMDDPDAPGGTWDHWIVWNMPVSTTKIEENSVPKGSSQALNSWGNRAYGGPCPPSGTHHYHFKLYALKKRLLLDANATKEDVERAMTGYIVGEAVLVGLYRSGH